MQGQLQLPKNQMRASSKAGHSRHNTQLEGQITEQLKTKVNSMMIRKNKYRSSSVDNESTLSCSNVSSQYRHPAAVLDWNVAHLTEDHVKEIERCNKVPKANPKIHYDYIAKNYEGMYLRVGFPDPKKVSDLVCEFTSKQASVKILDMACGTGLVGKYLSQSGRKFGAIDGIDLSTLMLDEARDKEVYNRLEEVTLSNPEEFPQNFKNKYDVVTCSGLINNNYMDYGLFEEMIMALKKGGIAVFAARYSYMGQYWYEPILEQMENDGRWKCLKTESFFKYNNLKESVGRFSKTPCKVYVFQNLQEELNTFKKQDAVDAMGFFINKASTTE